MKSLKTQKDRTLKDEVPRSVGARYEKVESEKVGLKLNIQKMKIMACGPITSWEIDRETVERGADFIFLGSKITADGGCCHEIEKTFTPWKHSYDQPS